MWANQCGACQHGVGSNLLNLPKMVQIILILNAILLVVLGPQVWVLLWT
jgi:hypothetical protein